MQEAESSVPEFLISPRVRERIAAANAFEHYSGPSCVMYMVGRREKRTPWYSDPKRAERALAIVRHRYGNGNIYVN